MFEKCARFISQNWLLICGGIILLLVLLYVIGYFGNGVQGYRFDLASVWVGVGVMAGTAVTGLGGQLAKYWVDSKYNSEVGVVPTEKEGVNNG